MVAFFIIFWKRGQPRKVDPNFRGFRLNGSHFGKSTLPGNFCTIRPCSEISGIFGRMESAL